jgi:hypothetical protein
MLRDLKTAANGGTRLEQFQKLRDYLEREKQAYKQTYTQFDLNKHEFVQCFISWGFARLVFAHIKPVVAADGAHLSCIGAGQVAFSVSPTIASVCCTRSLSHSSFF